uniref:Uncharacterized protein n=1 Tax=viral metagenome TaxID=1070528 RepID=A0A6C0H6N6_9ZZZZ
MHQEFNKIIADFSNDLLITFPEYKPIIDKYVGKEDKIFKHCLKFFSNSYLNILYENSDIFNENSDVNTEFLPGIVFKKLWNTNISDNTKNTIWKYLQLILIYITPFMKKKDFNNDAFNIFEAINEDELNKKIQETIHNIHSIFENKEQNIPNPNDIKDHLQKIFEGKIGKIAMEFAQEMAKEFNIDPNSSNPQQFILQMLKNPKQILKFVQNYKKKIKEKIESGEIKKSELMEEGIELLNNIKNMSGFSDIFKNMGMPNSKKMNVSAMKSKLQQDIKITKLKERMKDKINKKKTSKLNTSTQKNTFSSDAISDEDLIKMFQK